MHIIGISKTMRYMKMKNVPRRVVDSSRAMGLTRFKPFVLVGLLLLTAGLGYYTFTRASQRSSDERKAADAKTLQEVIADSKAGKCSTTTEKLKTLIEARNVEPKTEAEGRYLLGECLIAKDDYNGAQVHLKKALDLYTSLKDTKNVVKTKALINRAQIEINNAKREPIPDPTPGTRGQKNG